MAKMAQEEAAASGASEEFVGLNLLFSGIDSISVLSTCLSSRTPFPPAMRKGEEPRVNSFGPFKYNMIHICVQPLSWVVHSPLPESMSPSQSCAGGGRWTR